jgi:hypothetical protein
MKKFFALAMVMLLSVSLLTACAGNNNSGGENTPANSVPLAATPAADNSANSSAPASTPDNVKPGGVKASDITVNTGDVIFDTDYTTYTYKGVEVDYPIEGLIEIQCASKGKIDYKEGIAVAAYKEPLVINGVATDIYSGNHAVVGVDGLGIMIQIRDLEDLGISLADLKTVQAEFFIFPMGKDNNVLYERTVIFNIELP